MSGISKKFKKVLKVVAIAAVVWFTAGTASAYMAAPNAGIGSAMSASANSMWLTASGGAFVSGAEAGLMASGKMALPQGASLLIGEVGASVASTSALAVDTTGAAIASGTGLSPAVAGLDIGATTLAGDLAGASAAGQAGVINGIAGGGGSVGGITAGQTMAMMVGGQALSGAYGAYAEDKAAEREEKARKERGLAGFNWEGESAFRKDQPDNVGIINSQREQVVDPTQVSNQRVMTQPSQAVAEQAPATRPIKRQDLPKLQKQGLIAPNQVG